MMHTAYDELWPVVESRDQMHYPFVKKGKVTTRKRLVSCLKPPLPPHPCPLSRIIELMFESNPSQRCYPKNWNKKWSLQALDTCKRFSWKACIAVCRCRMFDSWCTSTYKVFQVPITLLCMVHCYTVHYTKDCSKSDDKLKNFRQTNANFLYQLAYC